MWLLIIMNITLMWSIVAFVVLNGFSYLVIPAREFDVVMQQNIPTILNVCSKQHRAYAFHLLNGYSCRICKLQYSPRLLSSEHSGTTLHRTSDPSLNPSISNTVVYIGHNVPTETRITITHNNTLPIRYTTYLTSLTFPLATNLLPIRFQQISTSTINTSAQQPCGLALSSLLLYQVLLACVNNVIYFDWLCITQHQSHNPSTNVVRVYLPPTRYYHHAHPGCII